MQLVGVPGQVGNEVDVDGELMLIEDEEELKEPLEHHLHQHEANQGHLPVSPPDH